MLLALAEMFWSGVNWLVSLLPTMPDLALPDLTDFFGAMGALAVYLLPMSVVKWVMAFVFLLWTVAFGSLAVRWLITLVRGVRV